MKFIPNEYPSEGREYTKIDGFRKDAERYARNYRSKRLLVNPGEYGHLLNTSDAEKGLNFISPYRNEILAEISRHGKAVNRKRTTENLLASQAMCFNLFVPLQNNLPLAARLFSRFFPDLKEIQAIFIEYIPPKDFLNDQTRVSGVSCDVMIRYRNSHGGSGILAIETKYVETEFSNCKIRKKADCPVDTTISGDFQTCKYARKGYRYWEESASSLKMEQVLGRPCPFDKDLWQLWVNTALVAGMARLEAAERYHFCVIYPKGNVKLTGKQKIFQDFRRLLSNDEMFRAITLESLVEELEKVMDTDDKNDWIGEFKEKYIFS